MLKSAFALAALLAFSSEASAMCGERGGPGCRLPNGQCAGWAQASYCETHPEAVEMKVPKPGSSTGDIVPRKVPRGRSVAVPP